MTKTTKGTSFFVGVTLALMALVAACCAATPAHAQQTARVESYPLFTNYDLDTPSEGTDVDQILVAVNLTNVSFTLDGADPDSCREVTVTIVDTTPSITTGTVTVTGTDCEGDAIVWAIDVSAGAGTYNSTDPAESGREDYYFATVTDITAAAVATLGGAGDETISAGVLVDTVPSISCVTRGGSPSDLLVEGSWIQGNARVETTGASNTVTGVDAAADAFLNVDVGDELLISNLDSKLNSQPAELRRVVLTNADDDTVTVNDPDLDIDDRTAGYPYRYRKLQCSQSEDVGWVKTEGAFKVTAVVNVERYDVDSETGIRLKLQCRGFGADPIIDTIVTTNVTAVGVYPLTTTNTYDSCRVALLLDSFDSAVDTGAEIEDLDGVMHVYFQ